MTSADTPRASYIAIAARAFSEAGYDGTSLARLADEARVTKQALLHFFGTKEALYAAVLEDLAIRLTAQIEAAHDRDPAKHLLTYFLTFQSDALKAPQDVCLVVRALLDSQVTAKRWPLKSYLDRLSDLAKQTDGGRNRSQAAILMWLAQMIGIVQYVTISAPAIEGMYGRATRRDMAAAARQTVATAVISFTSHLGDVADGTGF